MAKIHRGGAKAILKITPEEQEQIKRIKEQGMAQLAKVAETNAALGLPSVPSNPLKIPLNELGEKFVITCGLLGKSQFDIKQQNKLVAKRFRTQGTDQPQFISGHTLVVTDWTGPTDNGCAIYTPTGHSYIVSTATLDYYTEDLIERISMWSMAFSFEALETFIKEIFSIYLFLRKDELSSEIMHEFGGQNLTEIEYLNFIRQKPSLGKRSAEPLIKHLVKISKSFKTFEATNNLDMPLKWWFDSLTLVRHAITHGSFQIKKQQVNFPSENAEDIEQWYCNEYGLTRAGNVYLISFTKEDADRIIKRMFAFAFTIFKAMSIDCGQHWMVYRDRT